MNQRFRILIMFILCSANIYAQVQSIAISDFENTSGIAKYNGLGKALGSMLISDIESNVSPKRIQLVERSQINKILAEQNFQKSPNVDMKTAVDFGKILGVKFLLVGDVFVLNESIVINARLVNTETSGIYLTEKIEGNLSQWLILKTNLAKAISMKLNIPFQNPTMVDVALTPASIVTYSQAVAETDKGNFEKATQIIETLEQYEPNFLYLVDLKDEIEKIKKQVEENTKDIKTLEKSGGKIINATTYEEMMHNYYSPLNTISDKAIIVVDIFKRFPEKRSQFLSSTKNQDSWPNWDDDLKYQNQTADVNRARYDLWAKMLNDNSDIFFRKLMFARLMMNFLDFSFYKMTRDKTFELKTNADLNNMIKLFSEWNTLLLEKTPENNDEFKNCINTYVKYELYYTLRSYLPSFNKDITTKISTLNVLQENNYTKGDFSLLEKSLAMTVLPLDKNDYSFFDFMSKLLLRDYTLNGSKETLKKLEELCYLNNVFVSGINNGKNVNMPDIDKLVTSELLEKSYSVKLLLSQKDVSALNSCSQIGVDPWGNPENTIEYYCAPNEYVTQMLKSGIFDFTQTVTIWVKPNNKSSCSNNSQVNYILVNISQ